MAADGQLTEAGAKLDQKIPELIKSLGDAASALQPATGRAAGAIEFTPPLDAYTAKNWVITNIAFQEIN